LINVFVDRKLWTALAVLRCQFDLRSSDALYDTQYVSGGSHGRRNVPVLSSYPSSWTFWYLVGRKLKVKVKVWTLVIAPLTWVRLMTSSALQSRKWQLIGMSQWCCSALCGHPLPVLTDNWTHGAASRHHRLNQPHYRPSPRSQQSWATTYLPSRWGYEAELAWAHSRLSTCSRFRAVDRVWVEPATSRLRVPYSTTTPLHLADDDSDIRDI